MWCVHGLEHEMNFAQIHVPIQLPVTSHACRKITKITSTGIFEPLHLLNPFYIEFEVKEPTSVHNFIPDHIIVI